MSSDDVFGDEMNEPPDFDDETAESLLAGSDRPVDPELADLLGDVRVAFTSTPPAVGAELAALIGPPEPVRTPVGRFERMRSSMITKIGVGIAAAVAATGGLAVAGALPAPVQHAISHIGVGDDNSSHDDHGTVVDDETSTTVEGETTTTVEDNHDNHGDDVSGVAHDHEGEGCEHGHDVSAVASDGKSNNPCVTPTTVDGVTPTTIDDHGHDGQGKDNDGDEQGEDENDDHGHDGPPPTSVGTTPTTVDHGGEHGGDDGHDKSGSDHGGSDHGSGSDHSSGND